MKLFKMFFILAGLLFTSPIFAVKVKSGTAFITGKTYIGSYSFGDHEGCLNGIQSFTPPTNVNLSNLTCRGATVTFNYGWTSRYIIYGDFTCTAGWVQDTAYLNTSPVGCRFPDIYGINPACVSPEVWDSGTISCRVPTPTCKLPNTTFQPLANNEQVLFNYQEDNNRADECTNLSASIQERTQDCKKEYRCIKVEDEDTKRCRNIPVGSFVSPTSGIFHEDIELIGSEINLHYQSEYLNNKTIAHGWSLNLHHTLDADYIYLGSGTSLNIKDYKSQKNNSTIVTLGDKSYIFDSNNNHTLTKDNYTDKTLYSFAYNSNNSLTSISDAFSNTTTINRDANNIVTSITTPHGQINSISIDANKDLINVSYEDNSDYKFTYEEHLMISETEPNGNEFIHEFDANGKVIKVTDAQQGIWSFSNSANDTYNETIVNKASGDVVTYRDYFLADGSLVSKTIIASGDIFNSSSSIDGLSTTLNKCEVVKTINYQTQKDQVTKKRVPSSITTQMPSGLSKTTNYSQTYTFDTDILMKQKNTIETNGATTTSIRDYNLSNETIYYPKKIKQLFLKFNS
ncbi:hypothetical protein [Sulfurimonas sp.]|uniref:hypothetical protein n=1 Tax=Sulfurimonas sp. TaxID=2022749 RepID=UPI002B4A378B|nr:hypothetical protein [Sulfurimonas sp.]